MKTVTLKQWQLDVIVIVSVFCGWLVGVLAMAQVAHGADRDSMRQTFESCRTAPGVRQRNNLCRDRCDLDGDSDVDSDDWGLLQRRWYVPASQPTTQPTTQPALRPHECGCTCICPCVSATTRPDGADITWQVWRRLPQDLQREFDGFITGFGAKLATRPE